MVENISLSSFCRTYGLSKGSVHKFLKAEGFDTSNGLTPDMVKAASAYFLDVSQPTETAAVEAEIVPANFFQSSELKATDYREARLPEGFDPAAMVKFFDGVAGQSTDTSALVSVAQMAIQAADVAMQNKIAQQRDVLSQAEKDQATLDRMLAEAKVKLQISAMESKLLAERQTTVTRVTEARFQELMGMGKPQQPAENPHL
jgi:hypothetical protein